MPSLQLTLVLSGRPFREVSFDDLTSVTIGRSEECEVRLDNLGVSRRHAVIREEDGAALLVDLDSGGGLQVNGVRVARHQLDDGDVITIGKFAILVQLDGGIAKGGLVALAGAKAARAAAAVHTYVREADGAVTVLTRPCYLLGHGPGHDFEVPPRGLISRLFGAPLVAALLREDDGYRVVDVTPDADAVLVAGKPTADARLQHEQMLDVLGLRLEYHVGRPGAD